MTGQVDATKLHPHKTVSLFELVMPRADNNNERTIRLHSDVINKTFYYGGHDYHPHPCQFLGGSSADLDDPSDAPQFQISNLMTRETEIEHLADFLLNPEMTRVTKTRLFVKEFDSDDKVDITSASAFAPEVYYVERVSNRNVAFLDCELSTPWEGVGNLVVPRRTAGKFCPWRFNDPAGSCASPRSAQWTAAQQAEAERVGAEPEFCPKTLDACRLFYSGRTLPFGGFLSRE